MSGFLCSMVGVSSAAAAVANAAVLFDGTDDYYSATGITSTATDGYYATVAITFYYDGSNGDFEGMLNLRLGAADANWGLVIGLAGGTKVRLIRVKNNGSDGGALYLDSAGDTALVTNGWNQVVFWHKGDSASASTSRCWVNGVQQTLFADGTITNTSLIYNWGHTSGQVWIGRHTTDMIGGTQPFFKGRYSQIYIHNGQTSAPSISSFWNTTTGLPLDLGTNGTATGLAQPLIYHYGDTSTFPTNNGTGFSSYTLTQSGGVTSAAGPTYGTIPAVVVNSAFTDDSSTKILLHFENNVVDDNSSGRTAVATQSLYDSGAFRTDQKKFGSYSVGSTSIPGGWSTNNPTALNPGTGDFTIEFWFRPAATANSDFITMASQSNGSVNIVVNADNGFIGFGKQNISWDVQATTGAISVAWHHFAVTRSGTTLRLYLDGTVRDTVTGNTDNYTSNVWSFSMGGASGTYFHMDEFRISSIARYTSNFTVA